LLLRDGSDIKVGVPGIEGIDVEAKVLDHLLGPRAERLRCKSKKRVRVHHGGRADLTAIQILAVGGLTQATGTEAETSTKPAAKEKAEKKAKPAKASAKTESEAVAEAKGGAKTADKKAKPVTDKTDKKGSK